MIKIYRGQAVEVDDDNVTLIIKKPFKNNFSINDKLYKELQSKTITVLLPDRKIILDKKTPYLFKESVPSKFDGMKPWNRYWYKI